MKLAGSGSANREERELQFQVYCYKRKHGPSSLVFIQKNTHRHVKVAPDGSHDLPLVMGSRMFH